jgi:NADP-dependent aldehyde dehydrogenase
MTSPLDPLDTFDAVLARTRRAAPAFAATSREQRERVLFAMGAELDAHRDELIELAREETHYSAEILAGELTRTTDQFRFFGEVLADGSYLERATDADQGSVDVHRVLVPLGIVGVFGSSNFPFAYGVAGGDSASALASGCAVIVKEHPSHPETCQAVLAHLKAALVSTGFDPETVNMVSGFEAGVALVAAPDIKAVGFTGSTTGGRALYDLAVSRPSPIPFYGELGSLNPVVVSPAAAHERAADLGVLLAGSMLQRAGQMCTKPGVILISEGSDGDEVVRAMADRVDAESSVPLLNSTVRHQYIVGTQLMSTLPGVTLRGGALSEGGEDSDPVRAALFEATTSEFSGAESLTEVFGPTSIVLRYRDSDDARALLAKLEPALVGGVHAADEDPHAVDLMQALLPGVGRIVWNGATTGLAVGWATHHGGSYPASTSLHSSVGASAIRRWLRPVSYQGVPDQFLPAELAPAGAVR